MRACRTVSALWRQMRTSCKRTLRAQNGRSANQNHQTLSNRFGTSLVQDGRNFQRPAPGAPLRSKGNAAETQIPTSLSSAVGSRRLSAALWLSSRRQNTEDHDSVRSFLEDSTVTEPGATVGKGELYDSYLSYCGDEAMPEVTKGEFGKILIAKSYMDTRAANERRWKGLRLRSADETSEGAFAEVKARVKLVG
jgi:hypothetical protein